MYDLKLGKTDLVIPSVGVGCMRMANSNQEEAQKFIETAVDLGLNFFDHADIYGGGMSEKIFSSAVAATNIKREDLILQSKCGIRKGCFDFSEQHILTSVDGILERLDTDYLDILLLHRPDTLFEPEEVAHAFEQLQKSGKVLHFGVSNQNPAQMALLQKYLKTPLVANQLQLSATNTGMFDAGFNVNMQVDAGIDRDNAVLEYCRLNEITIQAWSPFQYGLFEGVFLENEKYPLLNEVLNRIASEKNVTNTAIAISWILRHPAKIQAVVGTMNPGRLKDIDKARNISLTREQWYEIYLAAGNILP
ncbi:oxidoreductase [Erysipelotrichaceae bacterium]|nr:oxidoreductase [Erysipelotrichaceae bacterium]